MFIITLSPVPERTLYFSILNEHTMRRFPNRTQNYYILSNYANFPTQKASNCTFLCPYCYFILHLYALFATFSGPSFPQKHPYIYETALGLSCIHPGSEKRSFCPKNAFFLHFICERLGHVKNYYYLCRQILNNKLSNQ